MKKMNSQTCNPEILLPAGEFTSVKAAVQNKADAVYLGGKNFSARQNAKNFDKNDLEKAVSYCHARGVKVYQTLNTLIFDNQIDEVISSIIQSCIIGIDAFIVQDLGIIKLIRSICPSMKIHASTQMTVHTPKGAKLLSEMGVKRVVLARELSLSEIKEITSSADIETEVFVHGALCMSVSGQCYLSCMLGGRSGNRGCCAGTCRLPFTADSNTLDYALSLKDLCLAPHIQELKNAGITSLKIEGRMKRPEYVAAAAKAYSDAKNDNLPDLKTLQAVFSRSGFTDGYFTGNTGKDMFGYRQKDDVVSATTKLLKSLKNTYQKENGRIPLDMTFICKKGMPCRLFAHDQDGNEAQDTGMIPKQAIHKPLDFKSVSHSLSKLGGTIFITGNIKAEIDDGMIIPSAEINRMRRNICEKITAAREQIIPIAYNNFSYIRKYSSAQRHDKLKWNARFRKLSQIPFDMINYFDSFSLPLDEVISHAESLTKYKDKLIVEPDRVMFGRESVIQNQLSQIKRLGFNHLFCNNLSHIFLAKKLGFIAHGGAYLNCTNSLSADMLSSMGIVSQTLSFESNLMNAVKINANIPLGIIAYGYLPLMITRNCPIKNKFSCKECNSEKFLTDRLGIHFRVICNKGRYSELLNSVPLYLADRLNELNDLSYATFYFTIETKTECREIIEKYIAHTPSEKKFTRGLYYRNI